jgi:hypothetical protein
MPLFRFATAAVPAALATQQPHGILLVENWFQDLRTTYRSETIVRSTATLGNMIFERLRPSGSEDRCPWDPNNLVLVGTNVGVDMPYGVYSGTFSEFFTDCAFNPTRWCTKPFTVSHFSPRTEVRLDTTVADCTAGWGSGGGSGGGGGGGGGGKPGPKPVPTSAGIQMKSIYRRGSGIAGIRPGPVPVPVG